MSYCKGSERCSLDFIEDEMDRFKICLFLLDFVGRVQHIAPLIKGLLTVGFPY